MIELGNIILGNSKRFKCRLKNINGSYQNADEILFGVIDWDDKIIIENLIPTKDSDVGSGAYYMDLNVTNNSFSKGAYICYFEGNVSLATGPFYFYDEALFYVEERGKT